jgi:voltage-gated potassium channel
MTINSAQRRLFTILEPGKGADITSKICDRIIIFVTLAAVSCAVLETVPSLLSSKPLFDRIEVGFTFFFAVELLARLWVAPVGVPTLAPGQARTRYLGSFYGLVDVMTVLPAFLNFFIPGIDLSVLRILRTLRILKISHYNTALTDLFSAVYHERKAFFSSAYLLAIALTLSASVIFYVEHDMQPEKFSSIPAAMWWSIITLTTVGYGDVSPMTPVGQVVGAITALMGVCTLALLTGIVTNSFSAQLSKKKHIFEMAVLRALADGLISESERDQLHALADEFNIAREHAVSILEGLSKSVSTDSALRALPRE